MTVKTVTLIILSCEILLLSDGVNAKCSVKYLCTFIPRKCFLKYEIPFEIKVVFQKSNKGKLKSKQCLLGCHPLDCLSGDIEFDGKFLVVASLCCLAGL